jgi:hypothetical protein
MLCAYADTAKDGSSALASHYTNSVNGIKCLEEEMGLYRYVLIPALFEGHIVWFSGQLHLPSVVSEFLTCGGRGIWSRVK